MNRLSFDRREFLIGAGAITAGVALTDLPAKAHGHPELRIDIMAEGIGNAILSTAPPPLPPGLEVRVRHTCPAAFDGGKPRHDLMEVHVYLSPPSAEMPLPNAPLPKPPQEGGFTISQFFIRIDDIGFAKTPRLYPWGNNAPRAFDYEFLLYGTVVKHPIIANPSPVGPFGDLVGRPVAVGAGFDQVGDSTTFVMLGGVGAGDHVTMCIGSPDDMRPAGSAKGNLRIDLPPGLLANER
jgi:hypothetical protein